MPANTTPIFTSVPNVGIITIPTTAVITGSLSAGTVGTNTFLAFTAGSNGSYVSKTRFIPAASNAAVLSVATTMRLFYSVSGSSGALTNITSSNIIAELSLPAITTAQTTIGVNYYDVQLNLPMPSGSFLLVGQHLAQTANQSWTAITFGGNY